MAVTLDSLGTDGGAKFGELLVIAAGNSTGKSIFHNYEKYVAIPAMLVYIDSKQRAKNKGPKHFKRDRWK